MRKAVRRKDREITDLEKIDGIMRACQAANIAFGGGAPYVIPMSYGFVQENGRFTLYMHGAGEGEKIERIKADPRAAFALFTGNAVYGSGEEACRYTTSFDSVCGSGTIRIVTDETEKRAGLEAIMAHYAPGKVFEFDEKMLQATCVMALDVESISGKHHD